MAGHLHTLLAVAGVNGDVEALERVLDEAPECDAITLVGDFTAPWSEPALYRRLFKVLGGTGTPAFWVPGPNDAPLRDYLREAYNLELVYPQLRGVHGTAALGPEAVVFAGLGGEILDDPDAIRGEEALLRYPGWEAEYRLKVVGEFGEYPSVFLFTTPPAHKGLKKPGSEVLAELINSHTPRVAVVAGDEPSEERLGTTLVVCPGRVDQGSYALVDVNGPTAQLKSVAAQAAI